MQDLASIILTKMYSSYINLTTQEGQYAIIIWVLSP